MAMQAAQNRAPAYGDRFVRGTVVAVETENSLITIRESNLLGHLRVLFRSYQVRSSSLIDGLQVGDKITAIFSKRDNMLHRVRRIQRYPDLSSGRAR